MAANAANQRRELKPADLHEGCAANQNQEIVSTTLLIVHVDVHVKPDGIEAFRAAGMNAAAT